MPRRLQLLSFDEGPDHYPPLGLLVVAQVAQEYGLEATVAVRRPAELDEVLEELEQDPPWALGLYVAAGPGFAAVAAISRRLRVRGVPVVWGGPLPSTAAQAMADLGLADVILAGKAEDAPTSWLEALEHPGGATKVILATAQGPQSFSRYYPDPTLLENPSRFLQHWPGVGWTAVVVMSRGCRRRCAFCAAPKVSGGRTWYQPNQILAAWQFWRDDFGVQAVEFGDDELTDPKRNIRGLVEALGAPFFAQLHVRTITEETADWLAEAGCVAVKIGAESGSDRMLAAMRKGARARDILQAAERLVSRGIGLVATFIAGAPGEGPEDLAATVDLMHRLAELGPKVALRVGHFTPYPGTRFWAESIERGFRPPTTVEGWAALQSSSAQVPWVPKRDMEALVEALNERFYHRRLVAWARLAEAEHPTESHGNTVAVSDGENEEGAAQAVSNLSAISPT